MIRFKAEQHPSGFRGRVEIGSGYSADLYADTIEGMLEQITAACVIPNPEPVIGAEAASPPQPREPEMPASPPVRRARS